MRTSTIAPCTGVPVGVSTCPRMTAGLLNVNAITSSAPGFRLIDRWDLRCLVKRTEKVGRRPSRSSGRAQGPGTASFRLLNVVPWKPPLANRETRTVIVMAMPLMGTFEPSSSAMTVIAADCSGVGWLAGPADWQLANQNAEGEN